MNELYIVLYQFLDKLRIFNLQFNYTSWLNRAHFLNFSGKKGCTKCFLKNSEI